MLCSEVWLRQHNETPANKGVYQQTQQLPSCWYYPSRYYFVLCMLTAAVITALSTQNYRGYGCKQLCMEGEDGVHRRRSRKTVEAVVALVMARVPKRLWADGRTGGRASFVRSSVDSWVVEEESDINEAPRQRAMLMQGC